MFPFISDYITERAGFIFTPIPDHWSCVVLSTKCLYIAEINQYSKGWTKSCFSTISVIWPLCTFVQQCQQLTPLHMIVLMLLWSCQQQRLQRDHAPCQEAERTVVNCKMTCQFYPFYPHLYRLSNKIQHPNKSWRDTGYRFYDMMFSDFILIQLTGYDFFFFCDIYRPNILVYHIAKGTNARLFFNMTV